MVVPMRCAEAFCGLMAVLAAVAALQSGRWQFVACAGGFALLAFIVEMLLREWWTTDFVDRWTPMTAVWGAAGVAVFVLMGSS